MGEGGHRARKTAAPLESLSCSLMPTSMKRNTLSEADGGWGDSLLLSVSEEPVSVRPTGVMCP